jgi:hypothetical protein
MSHANTVHGLTFLTPHCRRAPTAVDDHLMVVEDLQNGFVSSPTGRG